MRALTLILIATKAKMMALGAAPRTDVGTAILHAALFIAFIVLVGTGLRMAADDPRYTWLLVADWLLPVESLWLDHMLAGVGLTAIAAAYVVYMRAARLSQRIRLDWARLRGMARAGRMRWTGLNAIVSRLILACLVTEIVTGAMLYLDAGVALLEVHLLVTWALLGLVVLHVAVHLQLGGVWQLLRIFRPTGLAKPAASFNELVVERLEALERAAAGKPDLDPRAPGGEWVASPAQDHRPQRRRRVRTVSAHPLAVATAAALAVAITAEVIEQRTRTVMQITGLAATPPPRIDGDLSDPAWSAASSVQMTTLGGVNFGGTGQSKVEVKGVHDQRFVYLAFTWTDPTRSLKHLPLVKAADGWHLVHTRFDIADEERYYEDKFSVLLARGVAEIIGAAIHLSPVPLPSAPGSMMGRGLHYTNGAILDVWQWRAASGVDGGYVEDGYFGPPVAPDRKQLNGTRRYAGGYALDPGQDGAVLNFAVQPLGGYRGTIVPLRLPSDQRSAAAALGRVDDAPEHSESEGAMWCLPLDRSVPYSAAADARFATGSVIPGVIASGPPVGDRGSVRAAARWAAGRWTLEIVRKLNTGSQLDTPVASGTLMWVAAFDHAQTHHTRHLRPIILEVK